VKFLFQLAITFFLLFSLQMVAAVAPVQAGDRLAHVVPLSADAPIAGLTFPEKDLKTDVQSFGDDLRVLVTLKGSYNSKDQWTLSWKDQKQVKLLKVDKAGNFAITLPLYAKATSVDIMAVGPMGEVEEEEVGIDFPDYDAFKNHAKFEPPKRSSLGVSLGVTSINYTETDCSPLSELALTAKVSYQSLIFPPNWDVAFNVYGTAMPLTSTVASTNIRFLGANARIGFVVPFVTSPWRLSIMGGGYYTTSLVSQPAAVIHTLAEYSGFNNMYGPQIFPVLSRKFGKADSIYLYSKFSPIMNNFIPTFASTEFAVGGGWSHPLPNGTPLTIAVDFDDLNLNFPYIDNTGQAANYLIQSQSISISLGVGF